LSAVTRPGLEDTQLAAGATLTQHPDAARAAPAGLPAGKQLGHFRIERLLGAGGMGEVYLAQDLALDRPVAIKVLPEAAARDPRRRTRLIREARAQAQISHPNVGHIYFIGEDDDRLYFAMEYVPGETLAERIARGAMPIDDALAAIHSAVLGLREAQRHGFTHRDVKPSNLMLCSHATVKVLDFGLAAGDHESARDGGVTPVAQTSFAGTPLYMAPEQARGEAVDFRTDIYALGATLFHLVAGRPPFGADSVDELVSLHATAARPALPRKGRARAIVGGVDALCARMMAAAPGDRFASYDELLRAIELTSVEHTRPGGFWARGLALGFDLVFVTLALGILAAVVGGFSGADVDVDLTTALPLLAAVELLGIALRGHTPGMAILELEVVDVVTHRRPSWGRAIVRELGIFGLPLGAVYGDMALEHLAGVRNAGAVLIFGSILAGVAALAFAALRTTGKRALWDRLGGTMVRYRSQRRRD
jgi:tRNA A-37 threonylcarbamoyl transferase component Bud32